MMGTLAVVLAGKKIRTFEHLYRATVTGDIEEVEGVLKITRIKVDYTLKVDPEKREDARKALETYLKRCPAAQSVIGCIDISHQLILEDLPE
ncbi:MAG: OsmC family protein [Deltaproteobacteria bacterium]|nr:MAG: OsmC family protein [Deltaproteobacteria bacterium]